MKRALRLRVPLPGRTRRLNLGRSENLLQPPQTAPIGMSAPRKIFVKTFGCQMNVYDSERMTESLVTHGFAETQVMEDADLIVLNTCHIREKAAEKVYSDLGRIRKIKEQRLEDGKATIVTVAGCVAQAE